MKLKKVIDYIKSWLLMVVITVPITFVLHDWVLVNYPRLQNGVVAFAGVVLMWPLLDWYLRGSSNGE